MTLNQLIAQKRAEIAAKLNERAALVTELATIRGMADVSDADAARVEALDARHHGCSPARRTQRKPMWLVPVSIICGRRAAGR